MKQIKTVDLIYTISGSRRAVYVVTCTVGSERNYVVQTADSMLFTIFPWVARLTDPSSSKHFIALKIKQIFITSVFFLGGRIRNKVANQAP